jgi:LacI family transcriptional regulator
MAREIQASGQGVSAVFAANDLMALGAMRYFTDAGMLVPSQMAVAGFDDIFLASLLRPSLSSVAQPAYRMGAAAAEMLLERLDPNCTREEARFLTLETSLMVRDSTGGGRQTT